MIKRADKQKIKELEQIALALQNGKKLSPKQEIIVSKSTIYSFKYSIIIDAPFPLGEPAITLDNDYSFMYSTKVLKGRFKLFETKIKKNIINNYLKTILKMNHD